MSFVKLSKAPEGLEGSTGFLGRKWLEAVRELFGILNDTQEYNIAGSGITQSSATLLEASISVVATITAGVNDATKLPPLSSLKKFPRVVYNASGATMQIFPNTGDNFYGNPADSGTTMVNGAFYIFWPISATTWIIKG